ncbi:MAG: hypothetical protein HOO96_22385, partial [Polyangiaceae bacterium]|nr:hypothetical protein [Polyangiaceae bacterium]
MYQASAARAWSAIIATLLTSAMTGSLAAYLAWCILASADPEAPIAWPAVAILGIVALVSGIAGAACARRGWGARSGRFGAAGIDLAREHVPYARVDNVSYTESFGQGWLAVVTASGKLTFAISKLEGTNCHEYVLARVQAARTDAVRALPQLARSGATLAEWTARLGARQSAYRSEGVEPPELRRLATSDLAPVEERAAAMYLLLRSGERVRVE